MSAFGAELRRRRLAAGLTLGELAALLNYSKSHLSNVEAGRKAAVDPLARQADRVLNAGGELLALAGGRRPGALVDPDATGDPDERWTVRLEPNGSGEFWVGEPASPVLAVTTMPPLGGGSADLLDGLGRVFQDLRGLAHVVSPSIVLPLAISLAHGTVAAARQRTGRRRELLLLQGARATEFAGWMAQECGDDRGALWWTERAVQLAAAAGDRQLADYALVRQALVTMYRGDAEPTVGLAEQVVGRSSAHPRIRWLAALRSAQGYALGMREQDAMSALDRAAALADAARAEGDDTYGPSPMPERADITRAWCLYDLGRLDEAAVLLDHAVPRIPETAGRSRARYGTRQALVHAARGDLDRACAVLEPLLDTVSAVDSVTIRADLRDFARTVGRNAEHPAVQRLQPALADALSKR